eukprot:Rhum_TRINITY_DN13415_c4_g1::Rhum_TRINITY_DN13415_c4_g1_i1::g.60158::m.60158
MFEQSYLFILLRGERGGGAGNIFCTISMDRFLQLHGGHQLVLRRLCLRRNVPADLHEGFRGLQLLTDEHGVVLDGFQNRARLLHRHDSFNGRTVGAKGLVVHCHNNVFSDVSALGTAVVVVHTHQVRAVLRKELVHAQEVLRAPLVVLLQPLPLARLVRLVVLQDGHVHAAVRQRVGTPLLVLQVHPDVHARRRVHLHLRHERGAVRERHRQAQLAGVREQVQQRAAAEPVQHLRPRQPHGAVVVPGVVQARRHARTRRPRLRPLRPPAAPPAAVRPRVPDPHHLVPVRHAHVQHRVRVPEHEPVLRVRLLLVHLGPAGNHVRLRRRGRVDKEQVALTLLLHHVLEQRGVLRLHPAQALGGEARQVHQALVEVAGRDGRVRPAEARVRLLRDAHPNLPRLPDVVREGGDVEQAALRVADQRQVAVDRRLAPPPVLRHHHPVPAHLRVLRAVLREHLGHGAVGAASSATAAATDGHLCERRQAAREPRVAEEAHVDVVRRRLAAEEHACLPGGQVGGGAAPGVHVVVLAGGHRPVRHLERLRQAARLRQEPQVDERQALGRCALQHLDLGRVAVDPVLQPLVVLEHHRLLCLPPLRERVLRQGLRLPPGLRVLLHLAADELQGLPGLHGDAEHGRVVLGVHGRLDAGAGTDVAGHPRFDVQLHLRMAVVDGNGGVAGDVFADDEQKLAALARRLGHQIHDAHRHVGERAEVVERHLVQRRHRAHHPVRRRGGREPLRRSASGGGAAPPAVDDERGRGLHRRELQLLRRVVHVVVAARGGRGRNRLRPAQGRTLRRRLLLLLL